MTWQPELSYEEAHDRIASGDLSEVRNIAHVLVNERRYLIEEQRDEMVRWLVRDLHWPVSIAAGGDEFPESWRRLLLDAWGEMDGRDCERPEDRGVYESFIASEAGWTDRGYDGGPTKAGTGRPPTQEGNCGD